MDLNNEVHGNRLIQDTTTNPKSRGGLLPLMMESVAEVLVKEERRPEAIPAAVPLPIFPQ
jgi:hypothetical protein